MLQALSHVLSKLPHVHLRTTTRRARNNIQLARAKVQRLQDLSAHLHLLNRRSRQRHANSIANTLRQQSTKRHRALNSALERRTSLSHTQVQGPVTALSQLTVRLHHHHRVIMLHRNLEITETVLLKERSLPHSRLNQSLRSSLTVLLQQTLIQRTGVHTNTQRNAVVRSHLSDFLHLVVELTDITRVHTHSTATSLNSRIHVLRLEVDVSNHRNAGLLRNDRQSLRVLIGRARHTHNIATGSGQLSNLLQSRTNVVGLSGRHRLHRNRRFRTNTNRTHLELASFTTRRQNRRSGLRHTKADRQGFPPYMGCEGRTTHPSFNFLLCH